MTPLENLHYAIGQIAYAIAHADGKVQPEERKKFHDIVTAGLRCGDYDLDVSDIIFQILDGDKPDSQTAYDWAMSEIKLNGHYLSPVLKRIFIHVIERIAQAYPPITSQEANLIEHFKEDINSIHGDPVYYETLSTHKK